MESVSSIGVIWERAFFFVALSSSRVLPGDKMLYIFADGYKVQRRVAWLTRCKYVSLAVPLENSVPLLHNDSRP